VVHQERVGNKNRIKDFLDKTEKELTIFCRSPDLLREYRAALKRIEVLKIKVDRTEKFEDLGFATVEMKEGSERFSRTPSSMASAIASTA